MKPRTNGLLVWSIIFTVLGMTFYYLYSFIVPILELPNLLGDFSTVDLANIPYLLYGELFEHFQDIMVPPYLIRFSILGLGALFFLFSFLFGIFAKRARFFVHSILGLLPLAFVLFTVTYIVLWTPPSAPVDDGGNPYSILQFVILNGNADVDIFQKVIFGGQLVCAGFVAFFMLLLMLLNLIAFFKALKENKKKKLEAKESAQAAPQTPTQVTNVETTGGTNS